MGLDWKLIREGQKTLMQYGLSNPYVQTLLDHILTSSLMAPFDCKKLAEKFLEPTQRLMWPVYWEEQVDAAEAENLRLPQGDPRELATPEMMLGRGLFADPQVEAHLHTAIFSSLRS